MEIHNGTEAFYAKTRDQWREWLALNGQVKKAVWLIIHHKKSKTPGIYYPEAIEEALCFGWIDSRANKRDKASYYLYFTPRRPKGNWSKLNIDRAERMTALGLMTEHGQKYIDIAKKEGKWKNFG